MCANECMCLCVGTCTYACVWTPAYMSVHVYKCCTCEPVCLWESAAACKHRFVPVSVCRCHDGEGMGRLLTLGGALARSRVPGWGDSTCVPQPCWMLEGWSAPVRVRVGHGRAGGRTDPGWSWLGRGHVVVCS